MIPDQSEQTEIDVTDSRPLEVMESVAGVDGEYRAQGADAVVGIRMLKQELDSDTNRERRGNWNGHPEEDQWQDATCGFESLMHGVLHQSVHTLEPFEAVMNRVETPQPSNPVADQMHDGDAEIGNQHCEDDLNDKRKTVRPSPSNGITAAINGMTATLTKMRDS
ncbi:MAG: hypothetical protein ACI9JD_004103 [Rhodococcus sp. (in: high G+C Gram-positive bacteria)]